MPSLIDIRRRIRSVKNTQQITKAMKMVSAAKLRRAQERVIAARPYSAMLKQMMADLAAAAGSDQDAGSSPMLAVREEKRIQLILITADTGLAGAFNSNLLKASQQFFAQHAGSAIELVAIGRKGRDAYKKRGANIVAEHINIIGKVQHADAAAIAKATIERYANGEIDAVYLLNNEFKSVMAQTVVMSKILPVSLPKKEGAETETRDFIFEQPPLEILESLLPRYVEVELFRALLETFASYHAARMTAMDAASSNARDMIQTLTLNMNRVRQASITREIIEVVSGASVGE
jgi:F-type H+-transporting ATPase subunit gamma